MRARYYCWRANYHCYADGTLSFTISLTCIQIKNARESDILRKIYTLDENGIFVFSCQNDDDVLELFTILAINTNSQLVRKTQSHLLALSANQFMPSD